MEGCDCGKGSNSGGTGGRERFIDCSFGVKAARMHAKEERITERFLDGGTVQRGQGVEQERYGRWRDRLMSDGML